MNKFAAFLLFCVLIFASCRVQNAPGAYMAAEGDKPKKEVLVEKPRTTPKPEPIVVEEPEVEPEPEPVAEVKEEPQPVEKEVTRAENFKVVEGEKESDLKNYHVVVGSFKSQENAKKLQLRLRPTYNPVIVINEHGMFRVLLASFDDYKSAKQKIADIRSQFSDAWVLVPKK